MARLKLTDLHKPPRRYRPDKKAGAQKHSDKFETKEEALAEDATRLRSLERRLSTFLRVGKLDDIRRLKELIRHVNQATSSASSVYFRKHRKRIGGHLWSMVDANQEKVSTFTLIPRNWEFLGGDLDQADPRLLLEQLRQTLIRCGAQNAEGWLIAAIHGEHEPNENIFRLHVHGLASGGMRGVIDRLRNRRHYRSSRKGRRTERVHQRVRMSRQPLEKLPGPLTYILQSFWPERATDAVPISHVTNGVHLATWMANLIMQVFDHSLGANWGNRLDDVAATRESATFLTVTSLSPAAMRKAELTRPCQPGPPALNASSTSGSSRIVVDTLVALALGRPRRTGALAMRSCQ